MNTLRFLPGVALLGVLHGCAVQDAASGYGDEVDAATADDVTMVPAFDIPTIKPDIGPNDPDVGVISVDPDVGSPAPDTGLVSRPDVPVARDLGVVTTDRGVSSGVVCSTQTSCAACTAQTTCGWCGLTARCQDGTATGPVGTSCAMGWAWTVNACTTVDPCNASTSCTTCAAQAGCGWCGASSRCVTANTAANGPAAGMCASAWSGTVAGCTAPPPDPCNRYTQCGDCGAASSCGWCRSTRRCMTGSGTGPTPIYGSCASWAYVASQCTTPGDTCASSRGCGSCTDRSGCGWCGDSSTCHSGTSGGPTDGACRSGDWTWQNFLGFCSPF